ncbi:MAG: 3-phosphoshikimate 1-carboxyvinyltransferase [Nitrospira sp.]|nr:3-phosphoshikimate 1-carboxyvinyltransferase [Nitrospira sp.]MDH4249671.1 3-phosphoshikimate 1-carboxyvinyltransferase [Nitrospira sp.]MDH4341767.1 3-phosphoshikimate 1-carboxyvinyltransferase [Nitrospira sp.]MDH5335284.1 3-phosphoshikimate 1-carboxyvinyltransferase [Nitrospira sp.]
MTSLTITPGRPLKGTTTVPGDKSLTHRAIILTALGEGTSTVTGYCQGEDCLNTMRALQGMGIPITQTPTELTVCGKGFWGLSEPTGPIDCGNSGTGIRLLTGLLAGQDFFSILTGDESIRRRPMGRVVKPLREMGAAIGGRKGGELAPLAITGAALRAIEYASPVASAQIKSSILLAGLFAQGTTRYREPRLSRDHTERMFQFFGIPLAKEDGVLVLHGRPSVGWRGVHVAIPGDFSAAAFFIVGATIVQGSDITIYNVGMNPTRTGLIDVMRKMGADIQVLGLREAAGEPVADLRVKSSALKGVTIGHDLIPKTIDEFPVLCVAASVAEGDTVISGAEELRVKESDRIATMSRELKAMGALIEERPDGMIIRGLGQGGENGRLNAAGKAQSHGDHRVAMALAIGGLTAEQSMRIADTSCVDTSFPNFEKTLTDLLTQPG